MGMGGGGGGATDIGDIFSRGGGEGVEEGQTTGLQLLFGGGRGGEGLGNLHQLHLIGGMGGGRAFLGGGVGCGLCADDDLSGSVDARLLGIMTVNKQS